VFEGVSLPQRNKPVSVALYEEETDESLQKSKCGKVICVLFVFEKTS